mmetsp:Transcript_22842/g.63139  ORF Transcript_22842/g.63139 Transcript_22842/m.63139 type:complete len:163 (-) Transcript_22842:376-864(-)
MHDMLKCFLILSLVELHRKGMQDGKHEHTNPTVFLPPPHAHIIAGHANDQGHHLSTDTYLHFSMAYIENSGLVILRGKPKMASVSSILGPYTCTSRTCVSRPFWWFVSTASCTKKAHRGTQGEMGCGCAKASPAASTDVAPRGMDTQPEGSSSSSSCSSFKS